MATVGGVAGLIAILMALCTIDSGDELGMAVVVVEVVLLLAAFISILFTGLAAMLFAAGKARRAARALGIVWALSIAATFWWWWPHHS
jgi:O-antigen/teichoic acid export membrane protein